MSFEEVNPHTETLDPKVEDQPELVVNSPEGSVNSPQDPVNSPEDSAASVAPDAELVEFPDFGERYEVLARIGQGGMGSVYKVLDKQTGQTVAIKSMQMDLAKDTTALKRFEMEAGAASQLTHPNLVSVFAYGTTDSGTPYIVMDCIEGRSLAAVLDDEGSLSPERAVDLFIQIAEGLSHVHEKGIIHRDIKPTNVILTRTGDVETARLVDFGIAAILPTATRETCDLTKTGDVFGSPHYMSPEQCLGFLVDQRSDVYSLGCLMYEAVTGHPPFRGTTPVQLVVGHINNDAPPFSRALKANKTIAKLEGIILRCLEKEQALRFQTASELLADLELVKNGKSVPKYARSNTAKPTLTKRQALGGLALVFVCIFYLPSFSQWLGHYGSLETYSVTYQIMSAFKILVCAGGAWTFLSIGLERLRKVRGGKATPRQWSLIIFLCSLGLLGWTMMPFLIVDSFFTSQFYGVGFASTGKALTFSGYILAGFFAGLGILSTVVYLFSVSEKKVGLWFVPIRMSILALAFLLILFVGFPDRAGRPILEFGHLAKGFDPGMSLELYRLAGRLDNKNTGSLWSIARLQSEQKQFDDAIATMTEIFRKDKPQPYAYLERAHNYIRTEQFDKAEDDANRAISMSPRNAYAYCVRGEIRGLKNNMNGAIDDFNTSLKVDPSSDNSAYGLRVGAYCELGQYDLAFAKLDEMSMISNLALTADLVRGLINEHLGRTDAARKNFEAVVAEYEKGKRDKFQVTPRFRDANLLAAYAYLKLGRQVESETALNQPSSGITIGPDGITIPKDLHSKWNASDTEALKMMLSLQYAKLSSLE